MRIGYDAKRAFHNGTGLGHYSRTLIQSLSDLYPDNDYYLFNPKIPAPFSVEGDNIFEIGPNDLFSKIFSSAWRSKWVKKDLQKLRIQLYHGLSHEIPVGIRNTGIPSVVTIHDLIHERFPGQYKFIDTHIYSKKFRYACKHARKIIAISQQTKKDIIEFYKIPGEKIDVCYQSCNPSFSQVFTDEEKASVRDRYKLPPRFFLYVGSIIERKNLLNICKAVQSLRSDVNIPLVVIGDGRKYKEEVKIFIKENGIEDRVIFLSESTAARSNQRFKNAADFPAIYQSAKALIYPSSFEGFGIPVLEALWSRIPVITSNVSSLPEAGGPGAIYVDPSEPSQIASAMKKILADQSFVKLITNKGWEYAQQFTTEQTAAAVMKVYRSVW